MNDNESVTDNYRLERCTCRVCGVANRNKVYTVKEMMYGTKEEFDYFICENCNCMQIAEIPKDLGKYYADDYYSFQQNEMLQVEGPGNTDLRILDVGCGSGGWLLEHAKNGYGNLYGCDPFIEEELRYGERVVIKKCEIGEMEGKFDIIRFGDSFEHIETPLQTLEAVKEKLAENGKCYILIPVFPNAAWETFGVNWFQIDAPRHLFLHSRKSMQDLCKCCGLKIKNVTYDSGASQFIMSYLYEEGFNYWDIRNEKWDALMYGKEEMSDYFRKMAQKCNEKGYGDHAIFEIVHA